MKIWCVFSVENNHDHPDHNLVGWFSRKPTLVELAALLRIDFEKASQTTVLFIVDLWRGEGRDEHLTRYFLKEVTEAVNLDDVT